MRSGKGIGWKLHIIIGVLMLIIIAFVVYRLYLWEKSGDYVVMEKVDKSEFEYENLDYVFNIDRDILAEHGDDGINTILCIGDNVLTQDDYLGGDSIIKIMRREIPDSEVINLNIDGSMIADVQNAYMNNDVSYWQAGNLYDVIYAMCTKDYSLQEEALSNDVVITEEYLEKLKSLDLDKIDTVFILYSSLDYTKSSVLYDPDDDYNTATYDGALRAAIKTLQNAAPHIRIIVGSAFLHSVMAEDGVLPASMVNYGNGTLSEYVMRSYNIAMECCVSFEDNYFGVINEENVNEYCNVNVLKTSGIELVADHIVKYFAKKY